MKMIRATKKKRFIKIGADGAKLRDSAKAWVAVLDTKTGLMWDAGEGPNHPNWKAATDAAKKCRVAGFRNWRAPTREEMLSLVDDSRHSPAIDTTYFPNCTGGWFWTSTPAAFSPSDYAWLVYFGRGGANWGNQGGGGFVRAVRPGQ